MKLLNNAIYGTTAQLIVEDEVDQGLIAQQMRMAEPFVYDLMGATRQHPSEIARDLRERLRLEEEERLRALVDVSQRCPRCSALGFPTACACSLEP